MNRAFWKRYYYDYLDSFIRFLAPEGSDYVVFSDELGRIADIQSFLQEARESLKADGRIVITQYNALWEPILRLASRLGLREGAIEQNWLSMHDLKNFVYLAGLETVKSGTKMIMPLYVPLVSFLLNKYLANIWPFNHLGLFHYIVARKPEPRTLFSAGNDGAKQFAGALQSGVPSISIVVPARNEAGTIEKIAQELPALGSFTEIIFIEGNSTDDTYEEIKKIVNAETAKEKSAGMGAGDKGAGEKPSKKTFKFAKQKGKGKGDAVRKGFGMATGDILSIYDADMTVPPEEMKKFYDAIAGNKGDFINGSRLVYPMEKESMRVLNFLGNKFFSLAFSWILGQPLKDTLCGTKVLWREDYRKLQKNRAFFGDFDPFGDFDLLFGAAKLNLKIIDLPVHYKERIYGSTNISRWKHGWLLLKMTLFAARKIKFV